MNSDELRVAIIGFLQAGCGTVIAWVFAKIAAEFADEGKPIAPKTKRRVVMLLTVLVPTALYLVSLQFEGSPPYDWRENFGYVALAFTTSQIVHGEATLETGEQMKARVARQEFEKAAVAQALAAARAAPPDTYPVGGGLDTLEGGRTWPHSDDDTV